MMLGQKEMVGTRTQVKCKLSRWKDRNHLGPHEHGGGRRSGVSTIDREILMKIKKEFKRRFLPETKVIPTTKIVCVERWDDEAYEVIIFEVYMRRRWRNKDSTLFWRWYWDWLEVEGQAVLQYLALRVRAARSMGSKLDCWATEIFREEERWSASDVKVRACSWCVLVSGLKLEL